VGGGFRRPVAGRASLARPFNPDLTAGPYRDERALGLSEETAKLPWVGGTDSAQPNRPAESGPINGQAVSRLAQLTLQQLFAMVDATGLERSAPFIFSA
jgi:hypothetical protein